ncbi:hypothetical protein KW805_03980 [Candidatus Pacearchaeota archaeon]|nr:hypothetical protein [Candidatus Pacearchaeota archaeon]
MIEESGKGLKEVFRHGRYVVLACIIALIFYAANILFISLRTIISVSPHVGFLGTLTLIKNLVIGYQGFLWHWYSLIVISILTGILISVLWYHYVKVRKLERKVGIAGSVGLFLGLLAPACASCGIGLAAVVGLGAILAVLPFKGAEISFVAIILLIYSIIIVSSAVIESCSIDRKKLQTRKST